MIEFINEIQPELMSDEQIRESLQSFGKRQRDAIPEILAREGKLLDLMEEIGSLNDWREIRAHLRMLEEMADRLSQQGRILILQYIFPLLFDDNGATRRQSASTTGRILSLCIADDPEVCRSALHSILFLSGKKTERKRRWIGNALRMILSTLLETAQEKDFRKALAIYCSYFRSAEWDSLTCLNLLEGIMDIPWNAFVRMQRGHIFDFMRKYMQEDSEELRLMSFWIIESWLEGGWPLPDDARYYLLSIRPGEDARDAEHYLIRKIYGNIEKNDREKAPEEFYDYGAIFQENLRSEHGWLHKVINIDILKNLFGGRQEEERFIYAVHLLNMLRLNDQQEVFFCAGEDLAKIMPSLQDHQKYEIIQEILKAIELRDDSSNYSPVFLGRAFPLLNLDQQNELLERIRELSDARHRDTVKIIAETVTIIIKHMDDFLAEDPALEDSVEKALKKQRKELFRILYRCLASYRPDVVAETFFLVGDILFPRDGKIAYWDENRLQLVKKALIDLKYNPACQGKLYIIPLVLRMADCLAAPGAPVGKMNKKLAIFSGSFDPFSLGHQAVVAEAADMGFTVYLNIHNFNWSKNTQPLLIRRKMAALSIAGIEDAFLLPENVVINLHNPENLAQLKRIFPDREIHIIAGSDAAGVSDAYLAEPCPDSIHHFPHIVYFRNVEGGYLDRVRIQAMISGEITYLKLPAYYDNMTSREIRKNVQEGREIEGLVDIQVGHMIRDWKLYATEPYYKNMVAVRPLTVVWSGAPGGEQKVEVSFRETADPAGALKGYCRDVDMAELYQECQDMELARCLREKVSGKVVRIIPLSGKVREEEKMLVYNEILSRLQEEDYSFALCFEEQEEAFSGEDQEILKSFGFLPEAESDRYRIYMVDLRRPMAMFYDTGSFLKDPYVDEPEVRQALKQARMKLWQTLPTLYPGSLILHFDSEILHYKLSCLVRKYNEIPQAEEDWEEPMGNKLCVPFGKIFKGMRIPNTITKLLNAEKMYTPDLSSFEIKAMPDYPSLRTQIRIIRSFDKPVILVDDLYHKGYRMKKMDELLDLENVEVSNIIVAVMSGRGSDLARSLGKEVEAACIIPNMRAWLLESDMYPFIGGDGIEEDGEGFAMKNALPSINTLPPYQMPSFLKSADGEAVHTLAGVCLENSLTIYRALENSYQKKFHRKLTLERMQEVMAEPRYPQGIDLAPARKVSDILEGEIRRLARLYH